MKTIYLKILTILLLYFGEALSVYSEMIAAKSHSAATHPFMTIFSKAFIMITCAGAFLIAGYMLGYKSYKNIWVVSAMSITSILIMEPLLCYTILKQLPTRGALIGLILGAAGFIATFL